MVMKKTIILTLSLAVILLPGPGLAQSPHQVAGFVLGANIADYKKRLNMNTAIPIRYMEYIKEVEIQPMEGFKSGLIGFGTCTEPNPIVRIKLKYADSSKKFFEALLKRLKKRFGEPTEWRGDPFHVYLSWKWSFVDKQNNRISLTISHNTMDLEEKKGNAIKLTMTDLINKEKRCFKEKYPDFRKTDHEEETGQPSEKSIDWERYIPR